jgi:thiol-disulfide isomerase/thioredoxin
MKIEKNPDCFASVPVGRRSVWMGATAVAMLFGLASAGLPRRAIAAPQAGEPVAGFWSLQWPTPTGASLSLQQFRGRPLLLNFWATWCPPCVDELPLIEAFYLQNKANGWQVLGLAIDRPAPVQTFLRKNPLSFPIALSPGEGSQLARDLGNTGGALPFSVALGADGAVILRKLGRLSQDDLRSLAALK